jgi:hypothetical protein
VPWRTSELQARSPVDISAPSISFREGGLPLVAGAQFNRDVTPEVVLTDDADPAPHWTATLDGLPFTAGTQITAEGGHVLRVEAVDSAGNTSAAETSFLIDKTAPVIDLFESGTPLLGRKTA